jgi:hypothetical protein
VHPQPAVPLAYRTDHLAYVDISRPMIAWLTYRGELYSVDTTHPQAISVFTSERLRGAESAGSQLEVEIALD